MLIFAIDDERAQLAAAERIIGEAAPGSRILTFCDAKEALAAVTDKGLIPDVVFSDIEMPGISGLDLAVRLKQAAPDVHIVFITGYTEYAIEAFRVKARGYLLKPVSAQDVRDELCNVPAPRKPSADRLEVRCFGHFEVFWHGEPLLFQRKQTKELFAYLIDREGASCTSDEIAAILWEDTRDVRTMRQRVRNLISDLRMTLNAIGMENVLIRSRQQLAVRRDMVDCDYYNMLSGDIASLNSYRGEYMVDYSWAELTAGELYFRSVR